MGTYVMFPVSGALTLLAFGAMMVVQGGWQAADAAFAMLTGVGFLTTIISLAATGEWLESPAPRLARGRALARRAAATERGPEAAPVPVRSPQTATLRPRPRAGLSTLPS